MVCRKFRATVVHEAVQQFHHLPHIHPDALVVIAGFQVLLHIGNMIGTDSTHFRPHHITGLLKRNLPGLILLFCFQQSPHLLHLNLREKVFHLICHKCY